MFSYSSGSIERAISALRVWDAPGGAEVPVEATCTDMARYMGVEDGVRVIFVEKQK
jgi:hypothetical protein